MAQMQLDVLGKSVVVISPHDDDGIIGCAGVLSDVSHASGGTYVLIMTDGSLGYSSVQEKSTIKETRHREAESAYRLVGAKPLFLGFADMNLKPFASWETVNGKIGAYKKVLKILRELRPSTVFIPNPLDWHPDHQASFDIGLSIANLAAIPAAADFGEPIDLRSIYCYRVWDELAKVTHTYSLSQQAKKTKTSAISEFKSQSNVMERLRLQFRKELFQKLK
jgi:LmbE family N-acetylglucosaminyl deacetylase